MANRQVESGQIVSKLETFHRHFDSLAPFVAGEVSAGLSTTIDPKAEGIDLTPLMNLLVNNEHVLKVFHAGGQDIEIVFNMTGGTPHPLFDTQVAAMALGLGEQVGYQNLVESLLGRHLDKGARFTDWARRPLDKRQIDYAIGDVTHLAELFPKMLERLKRTGRGQWLDQEMERIADPANYINDPALAWKRVKVQTRRPDALGRLKALAGWRELEARSKNLPRGRIMKDETLADVAVHPPASQESLGNVRGLSAAWKANDIGARMMEALANADPLPASELPAREDRGPGLGKDGAKQLEAISKFHVFPKGHTLFRAGQLIEGLYVLKAGWARLSPRTQTPRAGDAESDGGDGAGVLARHGRREDHGHAQVVP